MAEAQLHRTQGHGNAYYEEQGVVVQEEERGGGSQAPDKKSVLKKVKAKAKKIKDTLKHHGHGHEEHDGEESLEEDDEMEDDPDAHSGHIGGDRGASAVTTTAIHHKTLDDFGHVEKPSVNPTSPRKDGESIHTGVPLHKRQPQPFVAETTNQSSGHGKDLIQSFEKMEVGKPEAITTGSHDQLAPEPMSSKDTESIPKSFDPSNPKDNLPRDPIDGKPSDQGSYAGKSAEYAKNAAMTVYEKVAGAGSAVMEKLPLPGGSGQPGKERSKDVGEHNEGGKSMTSTVKEKLAPVYDKLAAAGSSLVEKVQGPGKGQAIVGEGNNESQEGKYVNTDKGVSMKEYLAEKLKPGEEDRALSDMISGTLSRQKEETEKPRPMGKVTESEEVARRLGSIDNLPKEGSEEKGMVDMLKGAVNSWLGRDDELHATGHTNERNEASGAEEVRDQNATGEGRLQESGH